MPKLHELLAVNDNLKGQADKVRTDLAATFEKKPHLFRRKLVTFKPLAENEPAQVEEQSDIQTTVASELKWVADTIAQSLDVSYQIARTNMTAVADIVLEGGQVIAKDVPATALLELEKRTNELHGLVSSIPTLDPAKGFAPDPDSGAGIYRARTDVRERTKKTPKVLQLAPATDKHPAQVQAYHEDVPIGKIETIEWSGLITPAQKASMLGRVESLRRAVKAARSRANNADARTDDRIGQQMLSYVFNLQ